MPGLWKRESLPHPSNRLLSLATARLLLIFARLKERWEGQRSEATGRASPASRPGLASSRRPTPPITSYSPSPFPSPPACPNTAAAARAAGWCAGKLGGFLRPSPAHPGRKPPGEGLLQLGRT